VAVAEGTLKQIDCIKIRVRIAAMDFTCGPQSPRRIRIEYEAQEGAMPETVGVVRAMEFVE
jgi:hypothetical protein